MKIPIKYLHLVHPVPGLSSPTRPESNQATSVYMEGGQYFVEERGKRYHVPSENVKASEMLEAVPEKVTRIPSEFTSDEEVEWVTDQYGRQLLMPKSGGPVRAPTGNEKWQPIGTLPPDVELASPNDPDLRAEYPPPTKEQLERAARVRTEAQAHGIVTAGREHERAIRAEMTRHAIGIEFSAPNTTSPAELRKLELQLSNEQNTNRTQAISLQHMQAQALAMQAQIDAQSRLIAELHKSSAVDAMDRGALAAEPTAPGSVERPTIHRIEQGPGVAKAKPGRLQEPSRHRRERAKQPGLPGVK